MKSASAGVLLATIMLQGCAGLQFNSKAKEGALNYFDGAPYLFTTTTEKCASTATIVMMPAERRSVSLNSGYGSADLSVSLANGMIASVGQKTDTKVPETITAFSGALTAVGNVAKIATADSGKTVICKPTARLYPIENGVPNMDKGIDVPVKIDTVNLGADK